jgi:hypothetical protein
MFIIRINASLSLQGTAGSWLWFLLRAERLQSPRIISTPRTLAKKLFKAMGFRLTQPSIINSFALPNCVPLRGQIPS